MHDHAFPKPCMHTDQDQAKLSTTTVSRKHLCVTLSLALVLLLHLSVDVATSRPSIARLLPSKYSDSVNGSVGSEGSCTCSPRNAGESTRTFLGDRARMRTIVSTLSNDITYVHSIDTVFFTMAKAGSSTTWRMIYMGLTGDTWNNRDCGISQNRTSSCWQPYVSLVRDLSEDEQWRLLTSNKTLRVAIQREPFTRLVSAFKNKLACNAEQYNTVTSGDLTHKLRMYARMTPGPECMNVSEYAETLDIIRNNVGSAGYVQSLLQVDEHFRPKSYFADEIYHQLVIDASDLSNFTRLSPFLDRLPYADVVRNAGLHFLDSGSAPVMMDDKSARKIHDFAQLSTLAPYRYMD